MSFVEKRKEMRPASGEAPLQLDEVFFSRTDERGIIKSGNYIFRRTAHYQWDEMLNAPHKIVRHPDMPRGVFWLLWNTIQQGQAMGAYVKNLAKDGLYYWVFATVMPCEGGYLSVRIKPTTALWGVAREIYRTARQAEQEDGLTPEQSAQLILELITGKGFANYEQFATRALSDELVARDAGLSWPEDLPIASSRKMLNHAEALESETRALITDFATMRTIPHNMRVIASRLEPTGGPISTLSQNYGAMSQEISDWFERHVNGENSSFANIHDSSSESMFMQCMARILIESSRQLGKERRSLGSIDIPAERELLASLKDGYLEKSRECLARVRLEANRIRAACHIMHRQVLGLSTTRVMCKIEGARIPSRGESLNDIIVQLESFQSRIRTRLDRIAEIAEAIEVS